MPEEQTKPNNGKDNLLKVIFFTCLAGGSILFGFSRTVNKLRKAPDPNVPPSEAVALYEAGSALARKALFRASIYSVAGFGLFSYATYTLFGKSLIEDFNAKSKRNNEEDLRMLERLFATGSTSEPDDNTIPATPKSVESI